MFYAFSRFVCRILFKLLFRIRVLGEENLPPEGPVLVVSNHASFLDPVAVGIATRRWLYYFAKDDLFTVPVLGWLLRHLNSFPVNRERPTPAMIKLVLNLLKKRGAMLIFPEGRRSPDGKLLLPGEPGVGMFVKRSKAMVVPVAVVGSEKALPVGAKWIRCERIEVRFGKVIRPEEFPEKDSKRKTYQAVSDKIMERIGELMKS